MSQFSATSALELECQFLRGFAIDDKEGRYKAPPTGDYRQGWLYKVTAAGTHVETCGDNDAVFIGEQPVGTGPIEDATNREKYLQSIPQNICQNDGEITLYPIDGGRTISTKVMAIGSATGAITTSTAIGTQVEAYNGMWRVLQPGNSAKGEVTQLVNDDGYVEIYLY